MPPPDSFLATNRLRVVTEAYISVLYHSRFATLQGPGRSGSVVLPASGRNTHYGLTNITVSYHS